MKEDIKLEKTEDENGNVVRVVVNPEKKAKKPKKK